LTVVRRGWIVVTLVGSVVGFGVVSSPALAALPSCATPPAAYTGSDQVVAAVTQLNIDVDTNCAAETARVDQLDGDVTAFKSQAHGDSTTVATGEGAVLSELNGWTTSNPLPVSLPSGGSGQAVAVTNWPGDQTVGLDSATASQIDGMGQSEHGDLWVLIGTIIGVFAFDVFLRKVWP
jgi:hypothetical protein